MCVCIHTCRFLYGVESIFGREQWQLLGKRLRFGVGRVYVCRSEFSFRYFVDYEH